MEKPSWFRSLKRSLTGKRKKTSNLTSSSSGGVLAGGRLNKSDWDLRKDGRSWSESVPGLDLAQLSLHSGDGNYGQL